MTEPPKISVTASNQEAAAVLLTLYPRPELPQRRGPGSPPATPMPLTNQFRALTRTSISPHQSAQIDLMPGRYVVNAIINDAASPRPFALAGLLSVTNRETSNRHHTRTRPHRTHQQLLPRKAHTDASPMRDEVTQC